MSTQVKRTAVENGVDPGLTTLIGNGGDVGPIVRHAFEVGKPESFVNQLRNIVNTKEIEIEELCKLHYEDFILAVDELRGVLLDADDLKGMLSGENLRLHEVASALLEKLEELLDLYSVRKNVTEAIDTIKICIQVSNLCHTCNRHISDARFYPALNTLKLIEKDYLQNIPVKALRDVIGKKIPVMKLHIEKKVCGEFNDWLLHIRNSARDIGQLAIRQAASARQRDEEMRARQREAEEQSRMGIGECVYTLDIEDTEEDTILEFDLAPVYRAHHVHTSLRIENKFRDYYYKNRLMQLNLDLQISSSQPFLESHQPFFAQIAGFFIVEDRVFRTADGLLSESQVDTIWETAVSKMTSILEDQFSHTDTASHLLLIKDFVTLLGSTLRHYGYNVTPLLEALEGSREKYHELLLIECRKQFENILASDKFDHMVIPKVDEYNTNVMSFNLQSSDILPTFPYVAPFSSSVPETCRMVRSFIDDSVSYLSYGGQMNYYDFVKKYLDKLLIDVINDSLLSVIHGGKLEVSQAMQITLNISFLEQACDTFLFQAVQRCGIPPRLVERPRADLTAKTVFKASQSVAYNALLNLVNTKLDEFVCLVNDINWIAEVVPQDGNEYVKLAINFLEKLVSEAQEILPLEDVYKVMISVLDHVSDTIVSAFLNDNVKRFTIAVVMGIDHDLKKLESFAEESSLKAGLINLEEERTLKDCLLEPRQLVNLLLSNQPENFMNPVIRQKNYGALDYKKVACICDKFKDASDSLFGSLSSSRNAKQNARKKSMDMLKKRLKDFN